MVGPSPLIGACQSVWTANRADCSGFCKAVAAKLGVPLVGDADDIVDTIRDSPKTWQVLPNGVEAAAAAGTGKLVIAGLRGDEESRPNPHGHAEVIVPGVLNRGLYPSAYWGTLGGTGRQATTINWAWISPDRDNVTYAAYIGPTKP